MLTIERHDKESKGYVKAVENNILVGQMTYSKADDGKIIINHTEVNPAFSGKGVGKKLLMNLVEFAREKQLKIIPLCTFAKAMFARDKNIGDVLL